MNGAGVGEVPGLVAELNRVVRRLEELFPGRKFTLDGHLVGSIGEVVAAYRYELDLLPASAEGHDARTANGRLVQVKLTQGRRVGLRSEPEHLIVLRMGRDGAIVELYNGPGRLPWERSGPMQKNGQRSISCKRLESLAAEVRTEARIPSTRGRAGREREA